MNNKRLNGYRDELTTTNKRFVKAIWIYIFVMAIFGIFAFNNYLDKNDLTFEDFLNEKLNELIYSDYSDDNYYNDFDNDYDYSDEDTIIVDKNNELVLYEYYDNGMKLFSAIENKNKDFIKAHKIKCKNSDCSFINVKNENYYNDLFVLIKDGSNTFVYDTKRNEVFDFPEADNFIFIKDVDNKIDMDYFFIKETYNYSLYDLKNKKSVADIPYGELIFDPFVNSNLEEDFVKVLGSNVILVKYYDNKYIGLNYKNKEILFENVTDVKCFKNDKNSYCDLINDTNVELVKITNDNYSIDKKLDKLYYSDSEIVFGRLDNKLVLYNRHSKIVINTFYDVSNYNFLASSFKDNYVYLNFVNINASNDVFCDVYRYNLVEKSMEVFENRFCVK